MRSYILFLAIALTLTACGSNSSPSTPVGPTFDITSLTTIKIDQLKFSWDTTTLGTSLEPAIYLRCNEDGRYVACAGVDEGLDVINKSGLVYAKMNSQLINVKDVSGTCKDVDVVFVKKSSKSCPYPKNDEDTILWESGAVGVDEKGEGTLLNNKIENANDTTNWIRFVTDEADLSDDLDPSPAITDAVIKLDALYFEAQDLGDSSVDFILDVNGTDSDFKCTTSSLTGTVRPNIIFGNLGLALNEKSTEAACAVTDANKKTKVEIILTILNSDRASIKQFETDTSTELTLGYLVDSNGYRAKFKDDKGFIRFYPVEGF